MTYIWQSSLTLTCFYGFLPALIGLLSTWSEVHIEMTQTMLEPIRCVALKGREVHVTTLEYSEIIGSA